MTGDTPPWRAEHGIPGQAPGATSVAGATAVAPAQPWRRGDHGCGAAAGRARPQEEDARPVRRAGGVPGTRPALVPGVAAAIWLAARGWCHPDLRDRLTHTIIAVTIRNSTNSQLCQGKCSLRPAPPRHCTIKTSLCMSPVVGRV